MRGYCNRSGRLVRALARPAVIYPQWKRFPLPVLPSLEQERARITMVETITRLAQSWRS